VLEDDRVVNDKTVSIVLDSSCVEVEEELGDVTKLVVRLLVAVSDDVELNCVDPRKEELETDDMAANVLKDA